MKNAEIVAAHLATGLIFKSRSLATADEAVRLYGECLDALTRWHVLREISRGQDGKASDRADAEAPAATSPIRPGTTA